MHVQLCSYSNRFFCVYSFMGRGVIDAPLEQVASYLHTFHNRLEYDRTLLVRRKSIDSLAHTCCTCSNLKYVGRHQSVIGYVSRENGGTSLEAFVHCLISSIYGSRRCKMSNQVQERLFVSYESRLRSKSYSQAYACQIVVACNEMYAECMYDHQNLYLIG